MLIDSRKSIKLRSYLTGLFRESARNTLILYLYSTLFLRRYGCPLVAFRFTVYFVLYVRGLCWCDVIRRRSSFSNTSSLVPSGRCHGTVQSAQRKMKPACEFSLPLGSQVLDLLKVTLRYCYLYSTMYCMTARFIL